MKDQSKFLNVICSKNQLKFILESYKNKTKYITLKFEKDFINQDFNDENGQRPAIENTLKIELIPCDITKASKAIKYNKGITIILIPSIQDEGLKDKVEVIYNKILEEEKDLKRGVKPKM